MRVREAFTYSFISLKADAGLKAILALFCAAINHAIGEDWIMIEVMTYLIIIDWVFGTANAIKRKRFTSWKMAKVFYKLFFYFLLLIMAHQATRLSLIPSWFEDIVRAFIAVTEIKSILENSSLLGFKYATTIEKKLNSLIEQKFN